MVSEVLARVHEPHHEPLCHLACGYQVLQVHSDSSLSDQVLFLEKWMKVYPAALQVTQRPYGIPRRVRVKADSTIVPRAEHRAAHDSTLCFQLEDVVFINAGQS